MNIAAAIRSAWRALGANLLRSMLTMLGIIIGVAAVITMIAIGRGAQQRVEEQIRQMGTSMLLVVPGGVTQGGVRLGAQTNQALTEDDARAVASELPEVVAVAPSMRLSYQVVANGTNWATNLQGTTSDWGAVRDWPIADGRNFEPSEEAGAAKVAVLGQTVARELFGDADPVGQTIRVKNVPLTVIGVLSVKGQNSQAQDQDDVVLVPISTFRSRIYGSGAGRLKRIWSMTIKLQEGADIQAATENIRELLRQRHRIQPLADDDFSIRNLSEMLQLQEESSRVMTLLLAAVAGVSLVVGGIGIMNIMLVSVTERTREIGLRMAVGARAKDILAQFLTEAVTLSLVGGAIGIVLGAVSTMGVANFAGWPVSMSANAIVLAAGFAAAIGVFFGFYPARRASMLQPIDALRHE